ncbi:hypothetical protein H6P81_009037 [Aristolochia fimbriata]|uniref:Uncharacterized protein n=1 Tax=Aristolochia fimbriata TaxID=158543 RepID=A0AAV7EMW4_ARIFI|nr:hypothetical protein H6P81_009037 [Aristolochia fimbriata]
MVRDHNIRYLTSSELETPGPYPSSLPGPQDVADAPNSMFPVPEKAGSPCHLAHLFQFSFVPWLFQGPYCQPRTSLLLSFFRNFSRLPSPFPIFDNTLLTPGPPFHSSPPPQPIPFGTSNLEFQLHRAFMTWPTSKWALPLRKRSAFHSGPLLPPGPTFIFPPALGGPLRLLSIQTIIV